MGKAILVAVALAGAGVVAQAQGEQDLVARARAIHERVITLDTHNDIDPENFTRGCNYTMRLTNQVNLASPISSDQRPNIPRRHAPVKSARAAYDEARRREREFL